MQSGDLSSSKTPCVPSEWPSCCPLSYAVSPFWSASAVTGFIPQFRSKTSTSIIKFCQPKPLLHGTELKQMETAMLIVCVCVYVHMYACAYVLHLALGQFSFSLYWLVAHGALMQFLSQNLRSSTISCQHLLQHRLSVFSCCCFWKQKYF